MPDKERVGCGGLFWSGSEAVALFAIAKGVSDMPAEMGMVGYEGGRVAYTDLAVARALLRAGFNVLFDDPQSGTICELKLWPTGSISFLQPATGPNGPSVTEVRSIEDFLE